LVLFYVLFLTIRCMLYNQPLLSIVILTGVAESIGELGRCRLHAAIAFCALYSNRLNWPISSVEMTRCP